MTTRLQAFGQILPSSSGDLELLRGSLGEQRAGLAADLEQLSEEYEQQAGVKGCVVLGEGFVKDDGCSSSEGTSDLELCLISG